MQSGIRLLTLAAALPALAVAQIRPADVKLSAADTVRLDGLATLEFPWGMDYLPDGRLLITEKPGRLRIYSEGRLSEPLANVPAVAYRAGTNDQGGLLDVAVDPDFDQNRRIYLSYSEESPQSSPPERAPADPRFGSGLDLSDTRLSGGVVVRATLDGTGLSNVEEIWRQVPKTIGRGHFGHRILFGPDDTLYITSGDRMRFDPAQDLTSNLGKVVRIHRDGRDPQDNPFAGSADARRDVWSLGHRNILSALVHPDSGQLWVFEMGPLGGDELNVVEPGGNYGWPIVSNGDNYDKSRIADHDTRPEFVEPVRTWTPVISPSGALYYRGSLFPWRNSIVVGGLSSRALIRVETDGERVAGEERIDMQRRVRDVIEAPDGALLVITDAEEGELLRVTPARSAHE